MKEKCKIAALLVLGTLAEAGGAYFFKFPNHFSTGGVSGLAIILDKLTPLSTGDFVVIINLSLLLVGFLVIGRKFGVRTVFCTLLMSAAVRLLEWAVPMEAPLTSQPLLELIFAVLLAAVGAALLFYVDASTGGTDIIAMIIKKFSDVRISGALLIADFLVVMLSLTVFSVETWLYSVLGFFGKVLLVHAVLNRLNRSRYCTVITSPDYEEPIQNFIINTLHRSATVSSDYKGAYGGQQKCVLLAAVTPKQAIQLKNYVKSLHRESVVIIHEISEVSGNGFREAI